MYEYKFVEIKLKSSLKSKTGDTFEECKNVITEESKNGWRLKQIVMPGNEKTGMYTVACYQIIFEKEMK